MSDNSLPSNLVTLMNIGAYGDRVLALVKYNYTAPFSHYNERTTLIAYSILNLNLKDIDPQFPCSPYVESRPLLVKVNYSKLNEDPVLFNSIKQYLKGDFFINYLCENISSPGVIFGCGHIALCTTNYEFCTKNIEKELRKQVLNEEYLNFSMVNIDLHLLEGEYIRATPLKSKNQTRFQNNFLLTYKYTINTSVPAQIKISKSSLVLSKFIKAQALKDFHKPLSKKIRAKFNAVYIYRHFNL